MRSLFQNLKNKTNPQLRKRVLAGEVTPTKFVVMTHEEMKSDERRAEDKALNQENMNQAMSHKLKRQSQRNSSAASASKKWSRTARLRRVVPMSR